MNSPFVVDGERRLLESEELRTKLREVKADIRSRYAEKMAKAGFFRRLALRWRMAAEYRQERKRIVPSAESLYAKS